MSALKTGPRVRVGVGVFLIQPATGFYVLLKRQGAHGEGTWGLAGGHMEFGESPEETAARESVEETGINLPAAAFVRLGYTNDPMPDEGKHYITLFLGACVPEGVDPVLAEPDKAVSVIWADPAQLPAPLFSPLARFLNENPKALGGFAR